MKRYRYMFPFACFTCRRSYKRAHNREHCKCPHCGGVAVQMSRNFRAPKQNDLDQWKKVEYLFKQGFRFYHVYSEGVAVRYPNTLEEAKVFVRKHRRLHRDELRS